MKHETQLDTLRAISVSFVLFSHFVRPEQSTLRGLLEWGRMGVLAFFVLSGYLITRILLDHRQGIDNGSSTFLRSWRSFIVRRTLRIFPLYFFVLIVFGYLIGVAGIRQHLLIHALYLSNFGQAIFDTNYGVANHLWSLCVEEQFYLVWPILVLTLSVGANRQLCVAAILISAVCALIWVSLSMGGKFINYVTIGSPSLALSLGGLLAWQAQTKGGIKSPNPNAWNYAALIATTIFVLVTVFERSAFGRVGKFTGVAHDASWSIMAVWLIATLCRRRIPMMTNPIFVWVGKVSYGVYVYHLLLTIYFHGLLKRLHIGEGGWGAFWLQSIVTIAVASISFVVLERPFLRLKDRLAWSKNL